MDRLAQIAAALLIALGLGGAAAQAAGVGVVIMHGNLATPGQFYLVAQALELAGIGVEAPEMCWSEGRIYDKSPEDCMADVDAAFERLKARGLDQLVISGHSMGGINALLYASRHPELAAVVVFAPGSGSRGADPNGALRMAMALTNGGRGEEYVQQGNGVRVKATMLVAYNGPDSALNDDEILPNITSPILWIAGTNDNGQRNAEERFARIPANPLNEFAWIQSDHYSAPQIGVGKMIEWLEQFRPVYSIGAN